MVDHLTTGNETVFQRLYRTDGNFRAVAETAKANGWAEEAIAREYLLDLEDEEYSEAMDDSPVKDSDEEADQW